MTTTKKEEEISVFEEEIHLRDYLLILRKRKWSILVLTFTIVVAVTVISFRQIPIYQATGRILIEKEDPNVLSFEEVLDSGARDLEYITTQTKILQSRPIVEQVIQKLRLAELIQQQASEETNFPPLALLKEFFNKIPEFLGKQPPPLVSEVDQTLVKDQHLLNAFLNMVTISPVRGSRLLDINVRSTDPKLAAQIANTLIDVYMAQHLETKLSASKDAVRWLGKELQDAQKNVMTSEAALQAYKEQHNIISVEDRQKIVMQKLSELNTAVSQARIKRMALEMKYNQIQGVSGENLESIPEVLNNPLVRQLKVDLLGLESDLSELLKKFRSKHPTVTALQSQITAVHNQLDAAIQQIVTSIKNEYDLARAQEAEFLKALNAQNREAVELNQKTLEYSVLQREVNSNRQLYETLLQRTKEASVTERLETSNIRIVERATAPIAPTAPNKNRNILLALVVGLVMGTALAFFFEYWNDKINTPDDLKRYLAIPFLGIIPKVSANHILPHEKKTAREAIVATIVLTDPLSPIAEAFRGLRTNVTFSVLEQGSVFLVTSAEPGEGKSSIAANLAITMAQSGRKTLVIDCDFRKPMIEHIFNLPEGGYGFSDLIVSANSSEASETVQEAIYATGVQNLNVIPCGTIPPNPSELLSSAKTEKLIKAFGKVYQVILIDSPPVNAVTDPIILSRIATGGVILVSHAGRTKRDIARYTLDQLTTANAKIVGGVLNNVDIHKNGYYHRYHAYQYQGYYRKDTQKGKV